MAYQPANQNYTTEVDYAGTTNPVYIGYALPGSATSSAVWQIKRITYNSAGSATAIEYANGSPAFTQVWDNRASLSYS